MFTLDLENYNTNKPFLFFSVFLFWCFSITSCFSQDFNLLEDVVREGNLTVLQTAALVKPEILSYKNEKGQTLLMIAAYTNQQEIVAYLLKNNAFSINTTDYLGNTALMCAAFKGHIAIVKKLLAHNADASMTNNRGITALDYAAYFLKDTQIQEILEQEQFAHQQQILRDKVSNTIQIPKIKL